MASVGAIYLKAPFSIESFIWLIIIGGVCSNGGYGSTEGATKKIDFWHHWRSWTRRQLHNWEFWRINVDRGSANRFDESKTGSCILDCRPDSWMHVAAIGRDVRQHVPRMWILCLPLQGKPIHLVMFWHLGLLLAVTPNITQSYVYYLVNLAWLLVIIFMFLILKFMNLEIFHVFDT